eukprot:13884117-Alexandrium_andersonii.AAC.1
MSHHSGGAQPPTADHQNAEGPDSGSFKHCSLQNKNAGERRQAPEKHRQVRETASDRLPEAISGVFRRSLAHCWRFPAFSRCRKAPDTA